MSITTTVVAVVAAAWLSGPTASAARVTVSVDLGWRFHYGAPPTRCTSPFTQNLTGLQCQGLSPPATHATSVEECEAACCADLSCIVYQYKHGHGCFVGDAVKLCDEGKGWISFANTTRANAVPDYAAVEYDDTDWSVVDAPHDFIITGPNATLSPYDPSGNNGQGFIPKNVGVYRKHFVVPAEWQVGVGEVAGGLWRDGCWDCLEGW